MCAVKWNHAAALGRIIRDQGKHYSGSTPQDNQLWICCPTGSNVLKQRGSVCQPFQEPSLQHFRLGNFPSQGSQGMRAVELERHVPPAPATHQLLCVICRSSCSFPDSAEPGKAHTGPVWFHSACRQSGAKGRHLDCLLHPSEAAQLKLRNPSVKKSG